MKMKNLPVSIVLGLLFCFSLGDLHAKPKEPGRKKKEKAEKTEVQGATVAKYLITTADDFIVEVYHNGKQVPTAQRELLNEIFGATVEKINIEVRSGDWLVFHVVNNQIRWGGVRYFAVAGCLDQNEFGFVSDPESSLWSACDDPRKVAQFIGKRDAGAQNRAGAIENVWAEGDAHMKSAAGEGFNGKALWGKQRSTWIKVLIPHEEKRRPEIATSPITEIASPAPPRQEPLPSCAPAPALPTLPTLIAQGEIAQVFRTPEPFNGIEAMQVRELYELNYNPPPLDISPPSQLQQPMAIKRHPIQVLSAIYGTGGKDADVTGKVREYVETKPRMFSVSPPDLGADPNPYWNKGLHIVFMKDGVRREQHRGENEHVLPESFYGPQDANELQTWLIGTRWIGSQPDIQFHKDKTFTSPGLTTAGQWEATGANTLRLIWNINNTKDFVFDYTWGSFSEVGNAGHVYHIKH